MRSDDDSESIEEGRERQTLLGRSGAVAAALTGVLFSAMTLVAWQTLRTDCDGCPAPSELATYRAPEAPHVFDRSGRLIAHLSGPTRIWTSLEAMPGTLVEGTVAVEDRRFHEHDGVDGIGVVRAALENVRASSVREGASTITMQLARILWQPRLGAMNRWQRKAAEVRLANRIERDLSKSQILELYLNTVYMGNGLYGVGAAALYYFGKPPAELTPAEAALLVGTIRTPERYEPRGNPERALARRAVVLDVMAREGVLSAAEAAAAEAEELRLDTLDVVMHGKAYWAAGVDRELRRLIPNAVERRGVRVYTGLDTQLQEAVDAAVMRAIGRIESGRHGAFSGEMPDSTIEEGVTTSPYLQGAAIIMDARTGVVHAVSGGRSYRHSEFDRAFQARRQPGSAFKPIVYAAALDARAITLSDRLDVAPFGVRTETGEVWQPRDHVGVDEIGAREALARSSNRAAVRIGERAGIGVVQRTAARLGIRSAVAPVPSSYLGASEVTPAELVAAFAALGNGGRSVDPHFVTRIEDPQGRIVYRASVVSESVLDERVAFLVRSAMRSVVEGGTGWRVRRAGIPVPVAGKTGTSNEAHDVWFVGTTPHLAAGVWLGFDEPAPILRNATGGELAAPPWGEMMAAAYEAGVVEDAEHDWSRVPDGLRQVTVDIETGLAVRDGCATIDVRTEWYLPGTEPEPCPTWESGAYPGNNLRPVRRLRGLRVRGND
jgi:membrane peptidoglycan carboxypeptidase